MDVWIQSMSQEDNQMSLTSVIETMTEAKQ